MTVPTERRSIVAIDVTQKGLAYAFFEDARLIDWQTVRRNDDSDEVAILDRVLDGCAADILVVEDPDDNGCRLGTRARTALRRLARHERARGFSVRLVSRADVREQWSARGRHNKHEIAVAVGEQIPELAPLVPPPRRNYDPEAERMNVFDAVALVLHLFGES